MKRFNLLPVMKSVTVLSLFLFLSGFAMGQTAEKKDTVSTIPAEVSAILKPACMTCHSNEGRDKPKSKVNFSVWDQYSPMEKALLASSITDEVKKGSMPPKKFLEFHPEAALTASQIDQIVQWCDALKKQ
jgi:hypothetical protein